MSDSTRPPCTFDCPDRCIEPNCHNVDICKKWAKYTAAKEKEDKIKANEKMKRELMIGYRDETKQRYFNDSGKHKQKCR